MPKHKNTCNENVLKFDKSAKQKSSQKRHIE